MEKFFLAKWYTRIIGIFFLLVIISLILDYFEFRFRPETMHKIFHVIIGLVVVTWGWRRQSWWVPFSLINGALFLFVGIFGWLFMDFGELEAFNVVDTILHTIVGVSGLAAGGLSGFFGQRL